MNFLVGSWLVICGSIVLQSNDIVQLNTSSHMILIEYWESESYDLSLIDKNNYQLKDMDGRVYDINSIGFVKSIDLDNVVPFVITPTYSTVVMLVTERLELKKQYVLVLSNLKNKYGVLQDTDSSFFYYSGFYPNLIKTPNVNIK